MPISLLSPVDAGSQDVWFELDPTEISEISGLDRRRQFKCIIDAEDSSNARALLDLGFKRRPASSGELLDLAPFSSMESFLESIAPRNRKNINRGVRELNDVGKWKIQKFSGVRPEEFTALWTDLVIPFFSSRGFSLEKTEWATAFSHARIYSQEDYYLMSLSLGDRPVAAMVVGFGSATHVFKEYGLSSKNYFWYRPIQGNEVAALVNRAWFHPSFAGDLAAYVPDFIYWKCLSWAFENKVTLFSFGQESWSRFNSQYIGVLAFKKKWKARTFFTWHEGKTTYSRHNPEDLLWASENSLYYYLNEENSPGADFFVRSNAIDPEIIRLLEIGPEVEKNVFMGDPQAAADWSRKLPGMSVKFSSFPQFRGAEHF